MDIARPDLKKQKQRRLLVWAGIGVVVLTVAVVLVSRLKPAAPVVDASTVWPDTVKRGDMIRQVRGSTGLLVPREDSIELIPALTDATVVRIRVLPGTIVKPDTVLMDMVAPEVEQKLQDAQLQVKQAEADYKDKKATLQSTLMEKKMAAAQVSTDAATDDRQAKIDEQLNKLGVISGVAYEIS
jgi:HlyD family secretion protein